MPQIQLSYFDITHFTNVDNFLSIFIDKLSLPPIRQLSSPSRTQSVSKFGLKILVLDLCI